MVERSEQPETVGGMGLTAVVVGVVLGAAALLLATKQGQRILEAAGVRADDWKALAAAALSESLEKVVSSVEAETSTPQDFSESPGPRVRHNL